MDNAVPRPIQLPLPTAARQIRLMSRIGLAFSMGVAGVLACQPHAGATLPLGSTDFFAVTSASSLLRSPESVTGSKFSSDVLALPSFTTTQLPIQLEPNAQPLSQSNSLGSEMARLRDRTVVEADVSMAENQGVVNEAAASSLQLGGLPKASAEDLSALAPSTSSQITRKGASMQPELSKIIASLPTLNDKAHRSLAIAPTTKIATTDLAALGPLVRVDSAKLHSLTEAVSSSPEASVPQTAELPGSSPAEAEPSVPLAQGPETNERMLVAQSTSATESEEQPDITGAVAVIPAPQSVVNRAPNSDFQVPIAKRAVFPQLPSMELPPLASADTYLPSGLGGGRENPATSSRLRFISPARGVLTSGYGQRWGRMHRGIDIAGPVGTTIMASAPGVVATAGWSSGGYGNLVEIRHPDGTLTLYAHNSRIVTRTGQQVQQGQKIAEMGSTGRSTGPHVHFEVHPTGRGAVNPMIYLSRG
jgi:murein DD-endopeptidase MepM/ murein hydrolase activator NlpD